VFLFLLLLGRPLQKSPRLRRFKSDRGEIWRDGSPSKYAPILQNQIFNLTHHTCKMWPWRPFTQKSGATWWVKRKHLLGAYAATYPNSCSYLFPVTVNTAWAIKLTSCIGLLANGLSGYWTNRLGLGQWLGG